SCCSRPSSSAIQPPRVRVAADSAWRPGEGPAAEKMKVNMKHSLTGVGVGVDHGPIAARLYPFLSRYLGGHESHATDKRRVANVGQRSYMLPRHDQHVDRCLRVDVPEGDAMLVLRDELRGNVPAHDSTEETVVSHGTP